MPATDHATTTPRESVIELRPSATGTRVPRPVGGPHLRFDWRAASRTTPIGVGRPAHQRARFLDFAMLDWVRSDQMAPRSSSVSSPTSTPPPAPTKGHPLAKVTADSKSSAAIYE
jgi:hypothetical protein